MFAQKIFTSLSQSTFRVRSTLFLPEQPNETWSIPSNTTSKVYYVENSLAISRFAARRRHVASSAGRLDRRPGIVNSFTLVDSVRRKWETLNLSPLRHFKCKVSLDRDNAGVSRRVEWTVEGVPLEGSPSLRFTHIYPLAEPGTESPCVRSLWI